MHEINQPSVFKDKQANVFGTRPRSSYVDVTGLLCDRTVNASTATGAAAAIYCTLPANTGKKWVLDSAKLCIASIAANTAVNATIVDGTTALAAFTFSANGAYELSPDSTLDEKLKYVAANNAALAVQVSSAGTGSTTTLNLIGHLVTTADT